MEEDQRLTPLPRSAELREAADYPPVYAPYYDDDAIEGKRSVKQYADVVYKRLPLILALAIAVTAVAAFYMYRLPLKYQATTVMLIEPPKPKVTSKDAININLGNDINYYNTQLRLLRNHSLMKDVVTALGLYKEPDLFGRPDGGFSSVVKSILASEKPAARAEDSLPVIADGADAKELPKVILTPEEELRVERYAATLLAGLTVEQQERTNLVNVVVESTDPVLAAKVADTVAELFKVKNADAETRGAKQIRDDLAKSIEGLENTIREQENQLIQMMQEHQLPLQEKGQDLAANRLQNLSDTWMTAMDERRKIEARYNAAVQANSRGEGINIPDLYENKVFQDTMRLNTERRAKLQDTIREIDKQIQEAETEKAELLVKYTAEYPEVKKKEERIASLIAAKTKTEREVSEIIERDQKKIEREAVGGALVGLRSQLDAAKKREAQLLASYEQESARASVQGQAQTQLTTLKRSIETNRNLLDTYTQRLKEQDLAIANSTPDNIRTAQSAVVPTGPIGPQRNRNILIAFLVSLAVGVGLAFLLDYLDDSVKTSDDIGRHLGLPTLALIPHHNVSERRRLSLVPRNGSPPVPTTAMITMEERHSPMAEAYRHLRTSLLFSSAGKPPQTILVTSSQPSEGKTTTAINTAITLAQADADVVIIDCDLRRPRLHSYFEMENSKGLTNYLSGEPDTDSLIKICKTLPKLRVITSGPIPPNPAELLSSDEMKTLLQYLRGRYKHVIIDSPPAISFTDASILSTLVDGVVLVAMANKSSIHLMRRFKQRLGNIGARIYGVVLNGVRSNSVEYDYYGSGYYDYYGKSEADETPYIDEVPPAQKKQG
jgi:polysaccharide biosynthesis transport protein